jgi:hypothetical protein
MTARAFDVATTHPAFTPRGFRPGRYELVRKVESSCVYVRRRPRRFGRTSFGTQRSCRYIADYDDCPD